MATTQVKKYNNPFAPLVDDNRVLLKPIEYETTRPVYNLIPKAAKVIDIDGVEQDVITYVPVFVREYNIQEYIDSFKDDVGIQNILKKVALTGDRSLLNQTGRVPLNTDGGLEPVQDYTDVPESKTAAFNAVAAGVAAYDALPEEIKGKMSFAQFAEEFGQEQYNAFVQKLIEQYKAQNEPKEGDK